MSGAKLQLLLRSGSRPLIIEYTLLGAEDQSRRVPYIIGV